MTVIAYDGQTLCADSQVTSGETRFGRAQKILRLKDGSLLAGAGGLAVLYSVAEWLNGGEKPVLAEKEKFEGIHLRADGSAWDMDSHLRAFPACIPWAGGSGEVVALTAMHLGKTAAEAVAICCELDIYSSLPVQQAKL